MNTRNDVMKEKTSRRLRPIALLAMAMLTASVAVAGCSKPDSSRDSRTSGGNTIKCGTATCNKLTQKCENEKCVPKTPSTVPCGTSSCNPATQNCVGGQCVAKGGRTQCGSSTCDDDTQECKNGTCVARTIECGTRLCDATTQECQDGSCATKGSKVTCDPDFQVKQGDVCIIKNAGDGTCDSSPCTGSDICQNGQCVSVCKFCDESANYVGCFSQTVPCEYDDASRKYIAVNHSTNPPTKTECANPICGRAAAPGSDGHTPCYKPARGECGPDDLCVQIGDKSICRRKPQKEAPCGGACTENQQCNTANDQCEPIPERPEPDVCNDSAVVPPPNVTDLTFVRDTNPGESYRSVATVDTSVERHSASIGVFETAMNSCGAAQTSDTDYQVFSFHLDTFANVSIYSDTTSDNSLAGFTAALFNANRCSSSITCQRDFRISRDEATKQRVGYETLFPGNYYLIVKKEDLTNSSVQGTPWTLKVVKETYTTEGVCTGPNQSVTEYNVCDSNRKAYTESCEIHTTAPPLFEPFKLTCLTTTEDSQATEQGCYQESSGEPPECYGVTCDKPIVVDGSTSRTITFADLKSGDSTSSANYRNLSFTNTSCTPTTQPTDLEFTYVLKVTNLHSNSKVTISLPATGETFKPKKGSSSSPLSSTSAVVRFQSTCGLGEACLSATSFSYSNQNKDQVTFSYPQDSATSTPETLYVTVSIKPPSNLPFPVNNAFDLIIGSK